MKMVLSQRQREELNKAIADYLSANGYKSALEAFQQEADVCDDIERKFTGLLEKKWTSVIRLQKKVMDLEAKLNETQKEYIEGALTRGEKRNPAEMIPRPPAKCKMEGHHGPITCVACHPVRNQIVSASEDGSIKVWDMDTNQFEATLCGHTADVQDVCFDPSGGMLASCSADCSVKLWEFSRAAKYPCLRTLNGHGHNVSSVAFLLPDGEFVLSASRDKTVKMWDVNTGYCQKTFAGHADWVRMVRSSLNGHLLASCSNDKHIRIWNVDTKDCRCTFTGHEHVIDCIAWAPDSAVDAVSGDNKKASLARPILASGARDKTIRVWGVGSISLLFVLRGHDNWVRDLVFHPYGLYLCSASDDKTVRVWELKNRCCKKTLEAAHDHFCTSIDFHRPTMQMVTGSVDASLKIWECR